MAVLRAAMQLALVPLWPRGFARGRALPLLLMVCAAVPVRAEAQPAARKGATASRGATAAQEPAGVPPELRDPQTTLSIRADSQEKAKDSYHLRGHVEVTYRQVKLTADEATYDEPSGEVVARGHVTFTDPRARLEADEAHYNVQTAKGWFTNSHGYVHAPVRPRPRLLVTETPFYVQGKKVLRLDETTYAIEDGRLTSCDCEKKGWSMAARRARVEVGDKVVTHGTVFRLLQVPVFYFPVLINSIGRHPRQTGFLLPHMGNSSQKGFIVGAGFFWAINPSADLLLGLENFSVRGVGRTGQFRARPSPTSEVTVEYFGVNDKGGGRLRQIRAPGQSLRVIGQARDLGHGFRGVVDVDYITSLAFRFAFTDTFTEAVASEAHQTGFLTKNFDAYSINLQASRYQDFLSTERKPGNSIILRQTPGFSFSGMDKPVGRSPVYFAFEASAAGVGRTEPGFQAPVLSERLDFHPQVTLRSKSLWGFHLTPSAGFRATRYGAGLRTDHNPFTRVLGDFSVDLRPPSFEKVFSRPFWGHRFKHVIAPEVRYHLVRTRDPEDLGEAVRFDQVDIFAQTNEIEYSLTNSLLTRKDVPDDQKEKPQARQLLSWRLSQKYYFDPTFGGALEPGRNTVFDPTVSLTGFAFAQGRRLSPVVSVVKLAPFSNYDTELRADLNPSGGGVLNAGITSHLRRGPLGLAFTDFFINRTALFPTSLAPAASLSNLPSFNLLRTVATYGNVNRKGLSGAFGLDYNFAKGIAHQIVSQVSYNFGCFALDFESRRFALGPLRRENQFRVALSLANVGTFGNLKPRERLF